MSPDLVVDEPEPESDEVEEPDEDESDDEPDDEDESDEEELPESLLESLLVSLVSLVSFELPLPLEPFDFDFSRLSLR